VLEMTTFCMTPSVNSYIDNTLVGIASELNQPLFQFTNAMDVCMVITLLHGHWI